ncbi:MacB family efflux pump subunit [Paracoccus subflavus]|uniref:Pyoverdine export ATP-binding/permease protein PvdT n=1 Tax=Paracoccus subflavus TaxID=2528244 RepID=A0A4Q9G2S9_9RHOB|nr:MacB family efflux pump subunit [Paracoccus subflavus]TBN41141.1 MacB family efflux pump subunit [Paracoccus subflavus]
MDDRPAIRLSGIGRSYRSGDGELTVLRDVDLTVMPGEYVAIMGASGSGKTTLMNILGCLDRPSSGTYLLAGRDIGGLDSADLAALRRERFGFIFQRYHLLPDLSALGNVEIPAVYRGEPVSARRARAAQLLDRLGLGTRLDHRPAALSGGQQQRVSIARALMNDAGIILADEPTGALDSRSGDEVLSILDELNADGRTIIIVTHDPKVAARARRVIEISDGRIIADRRNQTDAPPAPRPMAAGSTRALPGSAFFEAARMAVVSMRAHKLRSFLTMLGIIIGIASVVSVVALGEGSRQRVLANIASLGTNTLEVFPGRDFGDMRSGRIRTLVASDAEALARLPFVAAATPGTATAAVVRYGAAEANAQISGVGADYFTVTGSSIVAGRGFDQTAIDRMAQEVVIDTNSRDSLFPGHPDGGVGQVIYAGNAMLRVVGVADISSRGPGASQTLRMYAPYTTVQARYLGTRTLSSLTLRIADDADMGAAQAAVTGFLTQRHGTQDFFIVNTDQIRQTITSTTGALTLLISAIAVISLVVGGIGVMNIMLVSVTERVSEIGLRMAVGARRGDILQQFLIEAMLVCLIGGILGIAVALGFQVLFDRLSTSFSMIQSPRAMIAALVSSTLIGITFGFLPARNASRLDPVAALSKG